MLFFSVIFPAAHLSLLNETGGTRAPLHPPSDHLRVPSSIPFLSCPVGVLPFSSSFVFCFSFFHVRRWTLDANAEKQRKRGEHWRERKRFMAETGSSIQAAPPRAIILPHGIYPIVMAVVGPCLRVPRFVSTFFYLGRRRKGSRMTPGFVLPSAQPCTVVPVVATVFAGELFPSGGWALSGRTVLFSLGSFCHAGIMLVG